MWESPLFDNLVYDTWAIGTSFAVASLEAFGNCSNAVVASGVVSHLVNLSAIEVTALSWRGNSDTPWTPCKAADLDSGQYRAKSAWICALT